MADPILIATRKSPLALEQTAQVHARLTDALPGHTFARLELRTEVDARLNWSLEARGGIGLFTKELEDALRDGRATLAVHSAKDMPTTDSPGLAVAGYLPRAKPDDVLVRREACAEPRCIATSSPRRRAQLALLYPKAEWTTIRGNVGTRLKKIAEGDCDASVLAAAGLERLGISAFDGLDFIPLSLRDCVPAPGQGAIAVQCRREDLPRFADLFCPATGLAVALEKGFLRRLGSGCQIPLGAHYAEGCFHLFHPDCGHRSFRFELSGIEDIEPALDATFAQLPL